MPLGSSATARHLFAWWVAGLLTGALPAPVSGQMAAEYGDTAETRAEAELLDRADYSWELQAMNGERLSLEQFEGKVLFINMWATWCAPCVAEIRSIIALRDSLADTDVQFLLISPERPRDVRRFLRHYHHQNQLPVYVEYERMPAVFGLEALPTTYIVDRQGRIVFKLRGTTNWDTGVARNLLRALNMASHSASM